MRFAVLLLALAATIISSPLEKTPPSQSTAKRDTSLKSSNSTDKFGNTFASPAELRELNVAATFARAAYEGDDVKDWACGECLKPLVGDTVEVKTASKTKTGLGWYVALNKRLKILILGFRGTDNIKNDLIDADFDKKPLFNRPPSTLEPGWSEGWAMKTPPKGLDAIDMKVIEVHHGFLKLYMAARDKIRAVLDDYTAQRPYNTYTLWITGHSLGGALGTLAAVDLAAAYPNYKIRLFTFESPRVGDLGFSLYFRAFPNLTGWRYVYADDVVPHLPPYDLGYHHVGQEFWTPSALDEAARRVRKCAAVRAFQEDETCSWNVKPAGLTMITTEHSNYFAKGIDYGEAQ
jgi:hypothetical protein